MTTVPEPDAARYPWGYLVIAMLPLEWIALILTANALIPSESMGFGYLLSMTLSPVGLVATGIGVIRIWRGDAVRYPALRSLVWVPAVFAVLGFVAG